MSEKVTSTGIQRSYYLYAELEMEILLVQHQTVGPHLSSLLIPIKNSSGVEKITPIFQLNIGFPAFL